MEGRMEGGKQRARKKKVRCRGRGVADPPTKQAENLGLRCHSLSSLSSLSFPFFPSSYFHGEEGEQKRMIRVDRGQRAEGRGQRSQ